MNQINLAKKIIAAAMIVAASFMGALSHAQQTNSSKLPPCPKDQAVRYHNCFGTFKTPIGDLYVGEFKDDKYHGQGSYTFADGDKYIGEYKDGKRSGRGTYYFLANNGFKGDRYAGDFRDGKRNGQGIYSKADGRRFEGIFENDEFIREAKVNLPNLNNSVASNNDRTDARLTNPSNLPLCPKDQTVRYHNCFGIFKTPEGHSYVGDFKDDKYHGKGTFTFPGGDKYVGEFKDGKRSGQGTYSYLASGEYKGAQYVGEFKDDKKHGQGTYFYADGGKYTGGFRDDKRHGLGSYIAPDGTKFYGEYRDNLANGQGIVTTADGGGYEGIWESNNFIREAKVNLPGLNNNVATNTDRSDIDRERQQLAEERRRLEEEKRQREQAKSSQRINLQVTHTQPNTDGSFFIEIKTNADTASLQIDGKEEGGKADGNYIIKRIARAGQASSFKIIATDVYGSTDTKTITVSRAIVDSKVTYAALNPGQVKQQSARDAVAIIIGIADYKSLPKADFANDDARAFYDYAIRALGIKPENIKLLVDSDAEEVEILRTFRNWLPSKVRSTTDVFVFYSGHGLPTADGQGLYLIPPRAAKDLIEDTAIPFSKINAALQSAKPKSVTMILDACYSGQARSGESLVASARPVQLKTESRLFPEHFTVITASQNDQISSSNPELQHGIFSYYLMKGMEGDADANRDGKITLGEMQAYLVENVGRQAGMMSRKQEPQLVGDANRVLVGR